jgi:ribosomal protein S3
MILIGIIINNSGKLIGNGVSRKKASNIGELLRATNRVDRG